MAKKPREPQRRLPYQIKTAVVHCTQVFNGETFFAVWKTRRLLRHYQQNVIIRLVKITCPGGVNANAKLLNKPVVDLDLLQLQEMQKLEPGAAESTVFLRQIEQKDVLIEYAQFPNGDLVKDQTGRILAMVFTRNLFGWKKENLGLELVRRGFAGLYKAKNDNDAFSWSTPAYERQFDDAFKDAASHRRGPLHHNAPHSQAARSRSKWELAAYAFLVFLFGVIVGFALCAFLMNIGALMISPQ